MTRITNRSWTSDQIDLLFSLIEKGASPARASVALRRPKLAIQNKARQLDRPFQDVRDVKAARLDREAAALRTLGRSDAPRGAPVGDDIPNPGSTR
jgi:hypothetical protein